MFCCSEKPRMAAIRRRGRVPCSPLRRRPCRAFSAAGCCRDQDPQSGRVREALAACAAAKACGAGKIEAPDPVGPISGPSVVRVGDRAGQSAAVHSMAGRETTPKI